MKRIFCFVFQNLAETESQVAMKICAGLLITKHDCAGLHVVNARADITMSFPTASIQLFYTKWSSNHVLMYLNVTF